MSQPSRNICGDSSELKRPGFRPWLDGRGRGRRGDSAGRFDLGRGAIVETLVKPNRVPPISPVQGRDFDRGHCRPGAVTVDEYGLAEAVDGLGEGVDLAVADGADGCFDSGRDERVGVGQ